MQNSESQSLSWKPLFIFGVILSLGLIIAAWIISDTIRTVSSTDTISVKGLAEKPVTADTARWNLTFSSKGSTPSNAYSALDTDRETVLSFLKDQGFLETQISFGAKSSHQVTKREYGNNGHFTETFSHYQAMQSVTVNTDDVQQMMKAGQNAFLLDEANIESTISRPEYLLSNLEEIKMSLIAEATHNAYTRASKFAQSGNIKVGAMKSARQGAFYILAPQGGTDDGDYGGAYDKTTINKIARVVVTINYGISY